ncbi:MAG TPA: hypothetical protein VFJ97_00040, partial [Dermatophilaceae bacterium]|nr:hypothetical protein [Dermatophilaceae bacterium]
MNPAGACALLAAAVVLLWPGRRPSPLQTAQPSLVSPGRGPFGRGRGRSSGEAEAAAVMAALGPGLRAGLTPAAVLSVLS